MCVSESVFKRLSMRVGMGISTACSVDDDVRKRARVCECVHERVREGMRERMRLREN